MTKKHKTNLEQLLQQILNKFGKIFFSDKRSSLLYLGITGEEK
jgi:hypothetical protein